MRVIYKYQIHVADSIRVEMPTGAVILCVQVQREQPCIWALVDDAAQVESRHFKLRGTGHELTGVEGRYIGSFQLSGGSFVGHLFEAKGASA